ncbi:MAG TPA: D-2-hydroxyacid dehydrogenase, partial [Vicinamibacteria bacterium]
VLVLAGKPDVYLDPIRRRFPDVVLESCRDYRDLEASLRDFRPAIVLAAKIGVPFPRETLFSSPSVGWVQTASAGVDHLLPLDPRVTVTSASGIHDEVLTDYIVCAVLMWNLHLPTFFRQQREHVWKSMELLPTGGQTLSILGLGSIGRLAAVKAKKLGMQVLGLKARPEAPPAGVDEVHGVERLREVASRSDFLAVTLPLTPKTRGLVGDEVLQSMKAGSVLINLSRGTIVDESALSKALENGPLRGAVMDVFAQEPLPQESALWDLPNLVITPHTGDIQGWREKVAELFCENLARRRRREPLRNVVDPDRGY